jgi:hypothetical protein
LAEACRRRFGRRNYVGALLAAMAMFVGLGAPLTLMVIFILTLMIPLFWSF